MCGSIQFRSNSVIVLAVIMKVYLYGGDMRINLVAWWAIAYKFSSMVVIMHLNGAL